MRLDRIVLTSLSLLWFATPPGPAGVPLIVRLPLPRLVRDTLIVPIQFSNLGDIPVRVTSLVWYIADDSTGIAVRDGAPTSEFRGEGQSLELRPHQVAFASIRKRIRSDLMLDWLRCRKPMFFTVEFLLLDDRLRPQTVILPFASLRREAHPWFVLHTWSYRYQLDTRQVFKDGRQEIPSPSNPGGLAAIQKRLAADSMPTGRWCSPKQ